MDEMLIKSRLSCIKVSAARWPRNKLTIITEHVKTNVVENTNHFTAGSRL